MRADATLKIGGADQLQYKGAVQYRNLDLSSVLNNPQLTSHLNGALAIDGYGTSLDNLHATFDVSLDSSVLAGRALGKTQLNINAANALLKSLPRIS